MATIKVKFRPSSIPSKEGVLYYQIIHNRVTRQIRTRFKLHPDEWNEEDMAFDFSNSRNNNRQHYLISLKEKVSADLARLEDIVDTFLMTPFAGAERYIRRNRELDELS